MRVFFPIEDGGIDDATAVLVPYRCGVACANALRGGLVLRDGVWSEERAETQRAILSSSPGVTPSLRAWPALSSST